MSLQRRGSGLSHPATDSAPHPGSFSIGSVASRAAARALIATKLATFQRLDFVVTCVGCRDKYDPPRVGEWRTGPDGTLSRISYIPWGMTLEEAEAQVRHGK